MLAIAVSCSVSDIDSIDGTTAPEITASFENDHTKTTITTDEDGVGTIWWTPADEINVFYDKTSTHYVSKNTENATTVAFGTTDIIGSTESATDNFWGLYPYDENAMCDGSCIITTIPSSQKAVAGAFADDLFTSLAHSTSTTMTFYNVLGGIKFSLSRDDIQSITFKGNNNEDIAGKVKLEMSSDGRPEATIVKGENTITITPKEGTTFAKNTNYYIVMLPNALSKGFSMNFETANEFGTFEYSAKSVEIKRSVFGKKENIDTYATFKKLQPYLLFSADSEQTFDNSWMSFWAYNFEYSINGSEWAPITSTLTFGGEHGDLKIRGINDGPSCSFGTIRFGTNAPVSCTGDIRTLIDYRNYTTVQLGEYMDFSSLFYGCTALISAPELPLTKLTDGCYESMFRNCTNLETAPELPAIELANKCYQSMFEGCTKLVNAPELKATVLAQECYRSMFKDCSSLKVAPSLPATTLANDCYLQMFMFCKSLVSAPSTIPASTMAKFSCYEMFMGCSSLTSAPSLPATTLDEKCYDAMFQDCISLTEAPELPAMALKSSAYQYMFMGCKALKTAPKLPATTLAPQCYDNMFNGCTSLETAPELPASVLASMCYQGMFQGCTSLLNAPELHAEILVNSCYSYMFKLCRKLSYIKCLAIDISATDCLLNWMQLVAYGDCTFVKSPENDSWASGESGIPSGWQIIDSVAEPEYVDLGLSVKWASFNLGATAPEEYGNYYAWGEVATKDAYYYPDGGNADNSSWVYYKWANNMLRSDGSTYAFLGLTKYTTSSVKTYNNAYDNKKQLDAEDDAAIVTLGNGWRMPTATELDELHSKCTWEWTTHNGVKGYKVSRNGKSIFLPCTGWCSSSNIPTRTDSGSYWSSSLNYPNYADCAWALDFDENYVVSPKDGYCDTRYYGHTIRPVHD